MSLEENIVQSLVRDESIRTDFRIDISLVISLQLIDLNFQLKIKLKKDGIDSWQYLKILKLITKGFLLNSVLYLEKKNPPRKHITFN